MKYDDDNSGSIDTEELAALLEERKPTKDGVRITAKSVMLTYDRDGGGDLDKAEFDIMLKEIGDPNHGVSRRNITFVNDVWSAEARRGGGSSGGSGSGGAAPTVALVHALNEPNASGSDLCAVAQRSATRVQGSRILAQGGIGKEGATAGRSVYATQLTSKPREFVCLTARTLRRWVERRPIDAIRERIGRADIGTVPLPLGGERAADGARDGGAVATALPFWDEIFRRHRPEECFAMLLALACRRELVPLTADEKKTLKSAAEKELVAPSPDDDGVRRTRCRGEHYDSPYSPLPCAR